MATSQDTMTDAAYRGQEAAYRGQEAKSNALHIWDIWADSVKKLFSSPYGKVPSAAGVVDSYFDFAEHVLETQREFAKSLVAYDHGSPDPGYDRDPKDMHYAVKDGASKKS